MRADQFHDRLAAVRQRFAASLQGKIETTVAELPRLSWDSETAAGGVEASYRRIHEMCGIAATVGFVATGRTAKMAEDILIAAFRGRRGLAPDELLRLRAVLDELAMAAARELHAVLSALPVTDQR